MLFSKTNQIILQGDNTDEIINDRENELIVLRLDCRPTSKNNIRSVIIRPTMLERGTLEITEQHSEAIGPIP
jgi:hypothetical protein